MNQLLDITPDDYHQLPGFSSSTAKTLLGRSPLHAWQEHPSYGGRGRVATKVMDRGTAAHTMLLGKGKRIACLPYDDWRTNAAKDAREKTRAAGLVPMLHDDYSAAEELAHGIKLRLLEEHARDARVPRVLDGISEQAMAWIEMPTTGPLACRGMMDHLWLGPERCRVLDLKVVDNASPATIERSAENMGYAMQAAAYTSGLTRIFPELAGRIQFLFLFVEWDEPHAINLVEGDGTFREIGERRWRKAVELWGRCVANDEWPAYGSGIKQITAPPWALAREGYTTEEF